MGLLREAGRNSFILTASRWMAATRAIGLISKAGRYGGTYAHKDIAFEFASWVSVEFKLYLIKEFQRLKDDENRRLSLAWNLNRTLSKLNYRIHTDAVKARLIPPEVTPAQAADADPHRLHRPAPTRTASLRWVSTWPLLARHAPTRSKKQMPISWLHVRYEDTPP